MIVDDLRAASAGFRELTAGAQVIRVPYRVCPFTDQPDGQWGLWWQAENCAPQRLIPVSKSGYVTCDWWRPPYDNMLIASESAERGVLHVRVCPRDHWKSEKWCAKVSLVGLHPDPGVGIIALNYHHMRDESGMLVSVEAPSLTIGALHGYLHGVTALEDIAVFEAMHANHVKHQSESAHKLDRGNVAVTFAVTMGLLCCKNVTRQHHHIPERLQIARRRRGHLPLVSWHTLKVHRTFHPARRVAGGVLPADQGEALALHWVRGHFKHYTPERPLLGRIHGTFWWAPHVAGRADRVVLKDYEVSTEGE